MVKRFNIVAMLFGDPSETLVLSTDTSVSDDKWTNITRP